MALWEKIAQADSPSPASSDPGDQDFIPQPTDHQEQAVSSEKPAEPPSDSSAPANMAATAPVQSTEHQKQAVSPEKPAEPPSDSSEPANMAATAGAQSTNHQKQAVPPEKPAEPPSHSPAPANIAATTESQQTEKANNMTCAQLQSELRSRGLKPLKKKAEMVKQFVAAMCPSPVEPQPTNMEPEPAVQASEPPAAPATSLEKPPLHDQEEQSKDKPNVSGTVTAASPAQAAPSHSPAPANIAATTESQQTEKANNMTCAQLQSELRSRGLKPLKKKAEMVKQFVAAMCPSPVEPQPTNMEPEPAVQASEPPAAPATSLEKPPLHDQEEQSKDKPNVSGTVTALVTAAGGGAPASGQLGASASSSSGSGGHQLVPLDVTQQFVPAEEDAIGALQYEEAGTKQRFLNAKLIIPAILSKR